jgi:putative aldouronate transport system substrate-binding protein
MNQPEIANSETSGAMLAIPAASKNKNEAIDFISLLYTDKKLVNMIIWGEEGKDYNFVAGKTDVIDLVSNSGYSYGQGWTMGNQFNNYLMSIEDPNKWSEFIKFNEAGRPLPALGFVPDTSDNNMQTWIAGMRAVRDNYSDLFRGYENDIDGAFARLEADYKAAGSDQLLAAFQAQFDAWLASK